MTKCCECKETSENFAPAQKTRRYPVCRPCLAVKQKKFRTKHKRELRAKLATYRQTEKFKAMHRRSHLKRRFGMTEEQYEALLQKQGGACAVCKREAKQFTKRLAVDHDHKSLKVRGLLCGNCNHRIVGRYREGTLLRAAADYLDNHNTGLVVPENRPKRRRKKRK